MSNSDLLPDPPPELPGAHPLGEGGVGNAPAGRDTPHVRPGLRAPHERVRDQAELDRIRNENLSISQHLQAAEYLFEVVVEPRRDPTWPALHMALKEDEATLLDRMQGEHFSSNLDQLRLKKIEHYLGKKSIAKQQGGGETAC